MKTPNRFALYELSVQSPERHIVFFEEVFREIRKRPAKHLREDFCGTFRLSAEWVRRNAAHTAVGIDLDPETLAYGNKTHRSKMTVSQRRRLQSRNENVLSVTDEKFDLIIACNFSFCIFKKRQTLVDYLRSCRLSLGPEGVVLLELAGGPGMIELTKERKTVRLGEQRFVYLWDQQSFDPITHNARYAIHFKWPDGREMRDAFVYDWRLWTIPEVRDALSEAGFAQSVVYWETEHQGKGTGEYVQMEHGDNAYAWIAYIVGVK